MFIECEKKINNIKEEYEKKINNIKEEYEKKISIMKDEINDLKLKLEVEKTQHNIFKELHESSKNCVEKIASQPKNNTSNISNNTVNIPTLNINQEHLSQAANNGFTRELFLRGQAGVAEFFIGYMKEANNGVVPFVVTDKSREVIKYRNKDQEIITDKKGNKLTQLAFDAVKTKNQEHYDSFYSSNLTRKDNSDNEDSGDEYNSSSDNEEETESDLRQELADKCFVSIKKLPKDNAIFRKKIIEGCGGD